MLISLPKEGKEAVALPHFPTRHQAFIFRAYEYISPEKIAKVLSTTTENVLRAASEMGLPDYEPGRIWLERGYITIIRSLWHILPYSQLLEVLEMTEEELAIILKEEDFLDIKLGKKPISEPLTWRELTEEEKKQTEKIKETMKTVSITGKRPFEFNYDVPEIAFGGNEVFSTRMIYAFSGLYQNAFEVDSEVYLPDEQLRAYSALGVNGIWTQAVLSRLVEFPFEPSLSKGYEERLERVRLLSERLQKFGMKLYLYINEPRYMPLAFFEGREDIRGHRRGGGASLCTSTEPVQNYLKDSIEKLCRAVPKLGGLFTITRSENLTNCYSHSGYRGMECTCPRCSKRKVGEVIGEVISCFAEGAHRVSRDIKVFAWSWEWDKQCEEVIRNLPKDVILLSQSELHVPFEIGGVKGVVDDYSMSIPGPGEQAKKEWQLANELGLETAAKVQINTTWEASTVPAIPVSPTVDSHIKRLRDVGVKHLLLSWTLGGYPCRNIAAAAKHFYERCDYSPESSPLYPAEMQFAKAFSEFPFDVQVLYQGPQNAGPSTLLFPNPTGYKATMTCYAYDDLESWRSIYPLEVFESQFKLLCESWETGLRMIPENDRSETAVMARAAYCLFKSSHNQIRFIRARDEGRFKDAAAIAGEEEKIARMMLDEMNENAAIGYEAANHYYFSKGQIAEKIVNCKYIRELYSN